MPKELRLPTTIPVISITQAIVKKRAPLCPFSQNEMLITKADTAINELNRFCVETLKR